jgi:putative ABC transport system permease protein
MFADIRYALRIAAKQPGFTMLVVLTMALGIGAATATFSIVDTVLLRPLPYKNADRLMSVFMTVPSFRSNPALVKIWDQLGPSLLQFNELRTRQTVFEDAAVLRSIRSSLQKNGEHAIRVGAVSTNFFPMLGIQTPVGRLFSSDDEKPQAVRTAVLSHAIWSTMYGGDPDILGKTITVRVLRSVGQFVVIGVLPPTFEFADYGPDAAPSPDIWISAYNANQEEEDFELFGTLKKGISIPDAEDETQSILNATLDNNMRTVFGTVGARISPRQTEQSADVRTSLYVLLGSAGLLLLIACGNVANLLVAQGTTRSHEIAVRAAIGAGRWRIVRQLMAQSVILSLGGGLLGTVIAHWTIQALIGLSPVPIPRVHEIGIDFRVLAFALAASTLTGILFGLVPALAAIRPDLNEVLKSAGRTRGTPHARVQGIVIVAEISLSFVLLIAAGLLTQTLFRMWSASNRSQTEYVLTVHADFFGARFPTGKEALVFTDTAVEQLRSLPGVESVTGASPAPFAGRGLGPIEIEGVPVPKGEQAPLVDNRDVLKDYFSTLRLPILAGRAPTADEISHGANVAVVNKTMARRFWPVETAVNKRFRMTLSLGSQKELPWITIVGVSDDSHDLQGSEREVLPVMYRPFGSNSDITFIIRTAVAPSVLGAAIRQEFSKLNSNVTIGQMETMDSLLWKDLAGERYRAILINVFAAAAASLALIGLYGVISRFVTIRTRELSIRMALGAQPRDVVRHVLLQSLVLTAAGIAIGIGAAIACSRLLAALLFGVGAIDLTTYAGIAAGLVFISTLAAYLPARRAARTDPMISLRSE